MESLNSKERISTALHPEVEQDLAMRNQQEQDLLLPLESDNSLAPHSTEQTVLQEDEHIIRESQEGALIDGRDLSYINENKGWYREGEHGREVEVEAIAVQPAETEGKYKMTAIINGEPITHEISQKQYDKFLAVDDYHRMKLFSKIFNEVDMKTRPENEQRIGDKDIRRTCRRCGSAVGCRPRAAPSLSGILRRAFQFRTPSLFQAGSGLADGCGSKEL